MTDELITTNEAARILGRSRRTVHRLVNDGRLTVAQTAPGGPHGGYLFHLIDVLRIRREQNGTAA